MRELHHAHKRRDWWLAKLEGNAARDKLYQRALRKLGWRTIVVWECETEKPKALERLARRLTQLLPERGTDGVLTKAPVTPQVRVRAVAPRNPRG